jgi:hypothetical protein
MIYFLMFFLFIIGIIAGYYTCWFCESWKLRYLLKEIEKLEVDSNTFAQNHLVKSIVKMLRNEFQIED